jgi:hypothetical protein
VFERPQGGAGWPDELAALGFNASAARVPTLGQVLAAAADAPRRVLHAPLRDNAAVRALAGAAARAAPANGLTEAHLQAAQARAPRYTLSECIHASHTC